MTKLDNVLYIIIALVDIKTSYYLSKTNEVWNKTRGWKKYTKCLRSFDIATLAIYSNNNGNMIVGEIPKFFQFPKRDIFFFFFHLKLNQFFLKEIVLVMRNCTITISEIEMVFRRADFRCSGSLYSMLLYKNCIGFKFSINIFWTKRVIHFHYVSTRWLVVSFLTGYLSEFGFLVDKPFRAMAD